jgi:hypothetical protein
VHASGVFEVRADGQLAEQPAVHRRFPEIKELKKPSAPEADHDPAYGDLVDGMNSILRRRAAACYD